MGHIGNCEALPRGLTLVCCDLLLLSHPVSSLGQPFPWNGQWSSYAYLDGSGNITSAGGWMQSGADSPRSPFLSGVAGKSGFLLQVVRLDQFSPKCAGRTDPLDGLCQESSRPKDTS